MYPVLRLSPNWLIKALMNRRIGQHLPSLFGDVVDLGCGKRPFEPDMPRQVRSYIGLDWNHSLHGQHCDVIADFRFPLPLTSGSVDWVMCIEVLEHVPEPQEVLAEAHRVVRSGGGIILSVPFQWWVHEEPWDYYRFTRHGLHYLLTKAGFAEIAVEPVSGFWSMWLLKLNYQLSRLVRGPIYVRRIVRAILIPFWWVSQVVAPRLDRMWPEPRETSGYVALARKC